MRATANPARFTSATAERIASSSVWASRWKSIRVIPADVEMEPSLQPASNKRSASSSDSSGRPRINVNSCLLNMLRLSSAMVVTTIDRPTNIASVVSGVSWRGKHPKSTASAFRERTPQRAKNMCSAARLRESPAPRKCVLDCFANVLVGVTDHRALFTRLIRQMYCIMRAMELARLERIQAVND